MPSFVELTQVVGGQPNRQIALPAEEIIRLEGFNSGSFRCAIRLAFLPASWFFVAETIDDVLDRLKLACQDAKLLRFTRLLGGTTEQIALPAEEITRLVGYKDSVRDRTAIRLALEPTSWYIIDESIDQVLTRLGLAGQSTRFVRFTQLVGGGTNQLVVQSQDVRLVLVYINAAGAPRTIIHLADNLGPTYFIDERPVAVLAKLKSA